MTHPTAQAYAQVVTTSATRIFLGPRTTDRAHGPRSASYFLLWRRGSLPVRFQGMGICFELREYDVDTDDLSAETVARKIGRRILSRILFMQQKQSLIGIKGSPKYWKCHLKLHAKVRLVGDDQGS